MRQRERLGIAGRGLHAADTQQRAEQLVVEPVLPRLTREVLVDEAELVGDDRLGERDEDVRRPDVPVVLRDLVLEDHVVAKGVPGELAREPVILMEVVTGVREDEIRIRAS